MIHLLVGAAAAAAGAAAGYLLSKKSEEPSLQNTRTLIEYRVAVHEAGHTVAAWYNPYMVEIARVAIDDSVVGNGLTRFRVNANGHVNQLWYAIAGHLGGIAAEAFLLDKFRSGPARQDRQLAKAVAREIARRGALEPPWQTPPAPSPIDFRRAYRHLTDDELYVLSQSYAYVRHLLERDQKRVEAVVQELLHDGVVSPADVRKIFGSRPFHL